MKKIYYIIILLICILIGLNGMVQAETSFKINNNIFYKSNAIPLKKISGFIEKNYKGMSSHYKKDIYINTNFESNVLCEDQGIILGYVYKRQDYMNFDNEAINYFVESANDIKHTQNNYKLKLISLKQVVEGIKFGYKFPLDKRENLVVTVSGEYLEGKELTKRKYEAQAVKGKDRYYMTGKRSGIYSNLTNQTEMYDVHLKSKGYSLGCDLLYYLSPDVKFEIKADNLYSRINWEDVYTDYYDYDQGIGRFSYKNYTTRLIPKYNISINNNRYGLGVYIFSDISSYIKYHLPKNNIRISYYLDNHLDLSFQYKGFEVEIISDCDLFSSKSILANVNYGYQF